MKKYNEIDNLERLIEENPDSLSLKIQYAELLIENKRSLKKARDLLIESAEKDPYHPRIHYLLGRLEKGARPSLVHYEKSLSLDPQNKEVLWQTCDLLKVLINLRQTTAHKQNYIKKGITHAKTLLNIVRDSEKADVFKFLAFLARKDKNLDEAIQYLTNAVNFFPNDPEVFILMNIILNDLRNYESALACAKRIIELIPDEYNGYYSAGLSSSFMGKFNEAAEYLTTASEKKPSYHLVYTQLGKCHLALGNYDKAINNFSRAIELFQGTRPAIFGIFSCYIDTGEYDRAIENLKTFKEFSSSDLSVFVIKTGTSELLNRKYINIDNLPNFANYFRLAENDTGEMYANQIDLFYRLSTQPESDIEIGNWGDKLIRFFTFYKSFLQTDTRKDIEYRRKLYSTIEDALRNHNITEPVLTYLFNRWSTVENYLNHKYQILPNLVLKYGTKPSLLVYNEEKLKIRVENTGLLPAKNVTITFQKSEKFKATVYQKQYDQILHHVDFSFELEPLEEGPLQLTAEISLDSYDSNETTLDLIAFRKNPYFYGRPVQSSEMFFGRAQLKNRIFARLTNVVKQDIILTGMRRIGKTSFLYQIRNALVPPFIPVLFSLQQVGDIDDDIAIVRQLFLEIVDYLSSTSKKYDLQIKAAEKPILDDLESDSFDIIARNFRISFQNLVEKLVKVEPGIRIVILLDEGDNLFRINPRCQNFFRDLLQKFERLVMLIAGSPIIRELSSHDFSSPFFNIFAKYDIKGLKREEVIDLVKTPMAAVDIRVDNHILEKIYRLCGGHPHFLQAICYHLVELYEEREDKLIRMPQLDEVETVVSEELKESFKGIWKELNKDEQVFLTDLAENEMPIFKAKRRLSFERIENLMNFELIRKNNDKFCIYSDLIKNWIMKRKI